MPSFQAKRDAWYTYNSTLYLPDGNELCEFKLNRWKDMGTFSIGGAAYRVESERFSGLWNLVNSDGSTVCKARKPKALRSRMIVDKLNDQGDVIRKVRMHPKGWTFNFFELSTTLTEEEAFEAQEGEEAFMSVSSGLHNKTFNGTRDDGELDDVYFAFLFFIALITYRRKKREIERARREARN